MSECISNVLMRLLNYTIYYELHEYDNNAKFGLKPTKYGIIRQGINALPNKCNDNMGFSPNIKIYNHFLFSGVLE